jgi:two-component system CheB/CheR fusion protein
MPRSAIDAGLADVVAPAEDLPSKIIAYRRYAPHISRRDTVIEDKAQGALEKIFVLLRAQTGNDFSQYKKSTVYRHRGPQRAFRLLALFPDQAVH